jgi:uncharacterized protein (TIGR02145 family)
MNKIIVLIITFLISVNANAQNVGIGTTSPATSAKLEVSSTTQGFLPPRITIAQRVAITNPAVGLVIFCTECDELEVYNGTIWKNTEGYAACVSPSLPGVAICNQVWMTKNLDVTKYRNGDTIPQVTDKTEWANLTIGAWCWYNNDSATYGATYGKLYNWYAVNDSRGLAPQGWHVPSDAEWSTLLTCLGGDGVAGGKMKETGTIHWLSPNTNADNSSGFTGLPGGYRGHNGLFYDVGAAGNLWSSAELNSTLAWHSYLFYGNSVLGIGGDDKAYGFSIRCLRD